MTISLYSPQIAFPFSMLSVLSGTCEQIEGIIREGVMPELVQLFESSDREVQREAAWCFANAASGGNPTQVGVSVCMMLK